VANFLWLPPKLKRERELIDDTQEAEGKETSRPRKSEGFGMSKQRLGWFDWVLNCRMMPFIRMRAVSANFLAYELFAKQRRWGQLSVGRRFFVGMQYYHPANGVKVSYPRDYAGEFTCW